MSINIDKAKLGEVLGGFDSHIQIVAPTARRNDWIFDLYKLVPEMAEVSALPLPSGRENRVSQCGTYWDGEFIHVWYGCRAVGSNALGEDIFYTKASSPFTSWSSPVEVITAPSGEGCRDSNVIVTRDKIYVLTQNYDGSNYRNPRIYSISKTANFAEPANYSLIGALVDLGGAGSFDDAMVASPTIIMIDGIPILAYEAWDSTYYSIGLAYSDDIESVPYTKIGQLKKFDGSVMRNPVSSTYALVPCCWISRGSLSVHYWTGSVWQYGILLGDPFANKFVLNYPISPSGWNSFDNLTLIGVIGDYIYAMICGRTQGQQRQPQLWRASI